MSIASARVSPSTFGTAVTASPLATHVDVEEVEVSVESVTVGVVVGAAGESSSVHPAKLSNPNPRPEAHDVGRPHIALNAHRTPARPSAQKDGARERQIWRPSIGTSEALAHTSPPDGSEPAVMAISQEELLARQRPTVSVIDHKMAPISWRRSRTGISLAAPGSYPDASVADPTPAGATTHGESEDHHSRGDDCD
jgi:hypothetical protein